MIIYIDQYTTNWTKSVSTTWPDVTRKESMPFGTYKEVWKHLCLFDTDATKRKDARKTFCQHINNVISASYGPDLSITHRCIDRDENEQLKIGIANNLFREKDPTHFCCARQKEMYDEVNWGIMYCPDCKQTMSTIDIVNKALQRWKDCLIPGDRAQHNRPDTMIPLSKERLDMAA